MLHFQTVEPHTRALLSHLMSKPCLSGMYLVGGTALSLHYGHRKSVDIDLFGIPFNTDEIVAELTTDFGDSLAYTPAFGGKGLFCFINQVKVDLIHFEIPTILPPRHDESGVRLLEPPDLCAMKINAILSRGSKKDFWDLNELLHHYTIDEIIDFHKSKYPNQLLLITIPQALVYFDDAENSPDPICLKGWTWEFVKESIRTKVRAYLL
jgi:hypothetical protein